MLIRLLKTILPVALLILSNICTFAQSHYSANIAVGAKGGVDMSKIFFSPGVKQNLILGTNFGLTFRYVEETHFGIIGELNFEQRGWEENFNTAPYTYKRTLNYIQIPVLAHIYFGSERARFFFNAGPEIGFLLGESTNSNFDANDIASLPSFPKDRKTEQLSLKANHTVDFGISAGLGVEVSANRKHSIYLESRFYYGLGNVLKSGRTEPFSSSNSMSIMVSAGYWFRIK